MTVSSLQKPTLKTSSGSFLGLAVLFIVLSTRDERDRSAFAPEAITWNSNLETRQAHKAGFNA